MDSLKLIPGVELNPGDTVVKCDGCGLAGRAEHLKNFVVSDKHGHTSAHKQQKFIKAEIRFRNVETGETASLCLVCQTKVVDGFAHGGMYK